VIHRKSNYDIKIATRCFENVTELRYFGTTMINQNLIQEETKRRLNSGNACYYSLQNQLFSRLLYDNIKIREFCLWFCMGAKLLAVRDEHRLRVFENRVLRRIFGPKRD
jgi:hypothetical protein